MSAHVGLVASTREAKSTNLGVSRFGQSGDLARVHDFHQIDVEQIGVERVVRAALDFVDS